METSGSIVIREEHIGRYAQGERRIEVQTQFSGDKFPRTFATVTREQARYLDDNSPLRVTVNWSACGAQLTEDAATYFEAFGAAMAIAEALEKSDWTLNPTPDREGWVKVVDVVVFSSQNPMAVEVVGVRA